MTHDDPSEGRDQDSRLPSIAESSGVDWKPDVITVSTPAERSYHDHDSSAWDGSSCGSQPSLSVATSDFRPLGPLRSSAKSSSSSGDMSSQVFYQGTDTSGSTAKRKKRGERGEVSGLKITRLKRPWSRLWTPTNADENCPICKAFVQEASRFTTAIVSLTQKERDKSVSSTDWRDTTVKVQSPEALQDFIDNEKDTVEDWGRRFLHSHEGRGPRATSTSHKRPARGPKRKEFDQTESLETVLSRQYQRLGLICRKLRNESPLDGSQGIMQSDEAHRILQRFIFCDKEAVSALKSYLPAEMSDSSEARANEDVDTSDTAHDGHAVARDLRGPSAWNPINRPPTATG